MSIDGQEGAASSKSVSDEEQIISGLMYCAGYLRRYTEGRGSRRRVLACLQERGPMTQRDIQAELGVRASSLSELLGKLEAKGYVTKERSGADKRNYNVSITNDGVRALEEMRIHYETVRTGLLSGLDTEEKERLSALLEKLQRLWRERSGEEPSACPAHNRPHRHTRPDER